MCFSRPFLFPLARTQLSFLPQLSTGWKCFGVWFLLFTSLCILLCSSTSNSVPLSGWCHHLPADEDETPSRGDPLPRWGQQDLLQHSSLIPRAAEKSRLAHVVPRFLFAVSKWIQVWKVLMVVANLFPIYYWLGHLSLSFVSMMALEGNFVPWLWVNKLIYVDTVSGSVLHFELNF